MGGLYMAALSGSVRGLVQCNFKQCLNSIFDKPSIFQKDLSIEISLISQQ